MSAAVNTPQVVTGVGWTALIYTSHIDVRVSIHRDVITEAVRALLPAHQRRFWTVEAVETDAQGRDLYRMEREVVLFDVK